MAENKSIIQTGKTILFNICENFLLTPELFSRPDEICDFLGSSRINTIRSNGFGIELYFNTYFLYYYLNVFVEYLKCIIIKMFTRGNLRLSKLFALYRLTDSLWSCALILIVLYMRLFYWSLNTRCLDLGLLSRWERERVSLKAVMFLSAEVQILTVKLD